MGLVEIKLRPCRLKKSMQNVEKLLQLLANSGELSMVQDPLGLMVDETMERYAVPRGQLYADDELDDEALEQLFAAGSKTYLQTRKR